VAFFTCFFWVFLGGFLLATLDYQDRPCADYVKECAAVAQRIHEQEPPGDILIFLTGMEEVDRCCDLLKVCGSARFAAY
jgi:HrpA-like RNA helicase